MKTVTLEFTKEELLVLNNALVILPWKDANPLITTINSQIQKQFDQSKDLNSEAGNN
jgi:hypothetical protein